MKSVVCKPLETLERIFKKKKTETMTSKLQLYVATRVDEMSQH